MSARKENGPDSTEHACMLCRRVEADPDICGAKLKREGIWAHEFCVLFANKDFHQGAKRVRFVGFILEDIQRTIEWAEQKQCFVCGKSGATIICQETGCERTFHLPCATEGGCVTQYFGFYRSFCWEHRPEQAVEAAPDENTVCLLCLDPVGDTKSYTTIVCPACKDAWVHRVCIQAHVFYFGYISFCCPLCQDEHQYRKELLNMGIRIPDSIPSYDDNGPDPSVNQKHRRCDASKCLCPGGREQAEEEGPWQLLLCSSCAAESTHRRCSSVSSSRTSWDCDSCAGLGTASSAISQIAGPITASQAGAGPSRGSPATRSNSPSTTRQLPSGSSSGSSALETRSRSRPRGPVRIRESSRVQRRAQNPYSRPSRRRRSSRARSPSAGPDPPPPAQ